MTGARHVVALGLLGSAAVLALRPADSAAEGRVPMLVAARDLPAGAAMTPADARIALAPRSLVPEGTMTDPAAVAGRTLAGAARAGEPLTDVRLIGAASRLSVGGENAAAVPIRLADAGVAELLHPGAKVDVVTLDADTHDRRVVAANATVLTVTSQAETGFASARSGRLVVISVPADIATRVAALSLNQPVAVTLR